MTDPKHTYALVSEKGWVHAVFNDEDRANEQAEKRSVPLDQVNPDKGLHCYSVVRYIPAEGAKAEAQPAGTGLLLQVAEWLHKRGHKSAGVDLTYNWNDPGEPGDGSCQPLHAPERDR